MRENVLITTGGSGGHVIPAMILFDHLSNYTHVTISTDRRGSRFLDKDNYNYSLVDTIQIQPQRKDYKTFNGYWKDTSEYLKEKYRYTYGSKKKKE